MATEQEQAAVIRALSGVAYDPVIIDLGAHHGEEYAWLEALGPRRYIAVEADPRNAAILRSKLGRDSYVTIIEAAIAAHNGTATLHLCDNTADQAKGSSSIHKPTGHLEHFKWCTFDETVKVAALTLDQIAGNQFTPDIPIDLLWVDIQGAERDMIAGGTEALKRTRFIMIEAESVEMYEGQALKPELLALLPDFDVVEDFGYNVFLKRKERCGYEFHFHRCTLFEGHDEAHKLYEGAVPE